MKKIFGKNKEKEKRKEQSEFGYFTLDENKLKFFLYNVDMELQPLEDNTFYHIIETNDKKYPVLISYTAKKLNVAENLNYTVTIKLTKEDWKFLRQETAENRIFQVKDVMIYDCDRVEEQDYFELPEDMALEQERILAEANDRMLHFEYVPSTVDGEFGTGYKKI